MCRHTASILYLSLFLWSCTAFAQNPYKFSATIDNMLSDSSIESGNQYAAWDYANIGEYQQALDAHELPYRKLRSKRSPKDIEALTLKPKSVLSTYKPVPAVEYILEEARKTRIVIINEAHHNARHRRFAESLLSGLYEAGYRYLGAETLSYKDSLLNQRKYPIISSGFYSVEAGMGNMLRTAMRQGYILFPYEDTTRSTGKQREIEQAQSIKRMMDNHPEGKFLIYCGFDHVIEDSIMGNWVLAMAGRVKLLTGIDPLTVEQVVLTETSDTTYDNPYRQAIHLDYSAVFIDSNGKTFNKAKQGKISDMHVYHPTTRWINGRPDWLMASSKRYFDVAPRVKIDYPYLCMLFNQGEDFEKAVPKDVIEIKSASDKKKLIVDKMGKQTVVVRNPKGERQVITID